MKSRSEFSIFLADEDPLFLSSLGKMLQDSAFIKITPFESCTAFLKEIHQKPDIILLNYSLSSMNGLEMLKKIKLFSPYTRVVFISGQENIDVVRHAVTLGAFDYLIKDQITILKVKKLMERAIALKKMISRNYKKSVFNHVLSTIAIPILVYLILETFFK
jgi:two-component system, NtrC family, response regulator AtoC